MSHINEVINVIINYYDKSLLIEKKQFSNDKNSLNIVLLLHISTTIHTKLTT